MHANTSFYLCSPNTRIHVVTHMHTCTNSLWWLDLVPRPLCLWQSTLLLFFWKNMVVWKWSSVHLHTSKSSAHFRFTLLSNRVVWKEEFQCRTCNVWHLHAGKVNRNRIFTSKNFVFCQIPPKYPSSPPSSPTHHHKIHMKMWRLI